MFTYGKKPGYDLVVAFQRAFGQVRRHGELHKHFAAGIQKPGEDKINEEHNLEGGGRAYEIIRHNCLEFYLWAGESRVKMTSSRYSQPSATIELGTQEDFKKACDAIHAITAVKEKAAADALYAKQIWSIPACARRK